MMAMSSARACKISLALSVSLLAAACGGSAPETFDLSAASVPEVHKLRKQIAIREPLTSLELDSQRILVRTSPETVAYLTGAQWSDRLPTLIQTRLVQTFQNAHLSGSVGRAGAGFSSSYSLELDVRAFELDAKSVAGIVDIAAKIVDDRGGRIVASRIFRMEVPSAGTSGVQASVALNTALSAVMTQIVAFTAAQM
jgi:cholesterol transport system auxiliary component